LLNLNQLKDENLKKVYKDYNHLVPIIGPCLMPVGLVIIFLGIFNSVPYISAFVAWIGFSILILAGGGMLIFYNIIRPIYGERSRSGFGDSW